MATSLSTYWVKFFTNAGFPHDVATKHAVVFSNNRIKPDMLPELDKPSLKEMGITLMGDIISITRYAKKVTEEMTCENFLVGTNTGINITPPKQEKIVATKLPIKRIVNSKLSNVSSHLSTKGSLPISETKTTKTLSSSSSSSSISKGKEAMKILGSTVTSSLVQKKKPNVMLQNKRTVTQVPVKRKVTEIIEEISSDSDDEWSKKRIKITTADDDDKTVYKNHDLPRVIKKTENSIDKKKLHEQKRTVFDRLGDSSVTSTTNTTTNDSSTTFNVTGLGDVFKRNNPSVFNRLGDKNVDQNIVTTVKNGTTTSNGQQPPQGILKSKISNLGSTTVKITSPNNSSRIKTGTMHADHEKNKNSISKSVKKLVKTTKAIKITSNNGTRPGQFVRKISTSKLASERSAAGTIPAKSRLGLSGSQKQVTFNRVATVAHIKKPGVFSRLGV